MGKPVVHWELMSKEPAKVSEFYEKVFDWKIQHIPEMNYRIVDTGGQGGINGGIVQPQRVARQYDFIRRCRRPGGVSKTRRRCRREDTCGGAGGAWHGRAVAVHRSRGTHDGIVEAGQEEMKQSAYIPLRVNLALIAAGPTAV